MREHVEQVAKIAETQNRERRALYSRAIRDLQMAPFRRLVVLQESKPFGLTVE